MGALVPVRNPVPFVVYRGVLDERQLIQKLTGRVTQGADEMGVEQRPELRPAARDSENPAEAPLSVTGMPGEAEIGAIFLAIPPDNHP